MLHFKLDDPRLALDAWGRPENIGAETIAGDIQVAGKILFGQSGAAVSGGVYTATRGRYRVVYPFHEHATIIDGEVAITDEASGVTTVYGPGDSWIIAQGTPLIWDIRTDHVRKSYLAIVADD